MWRSHHSFTIRSVLYKTRTAYTVLKSNNRIFFSSFLWRLICAAMKMTFCSCNDFFHSVHAILIGKEHRDWIPIYTGYPDALCSTRKNRNWCKRKGSCRRVQGCFFVCTIFDSFLNDLCGWCNNRQSSNQPSFAVACSSGIGSWFFTRVKWPFFRYSWLHFTAICHSLPFQPFSWQNVSAGNALNISANRGTRRQIGALERRNSNWLRYFLFVTAGL